MSADTQFVDSPAVQDRLVELRKRKETLARIKALREAFGLDFYRPHAKQDKFHRAAHVAGRYCRTGNRGGKTKCGAAEDVAFCLGYRPWYRHKFEVKDGKGNVVRVHDPVANPEDFALITLGIPQRPIKLLLIVTDWDKSNEIFTNNVGSYENWGEYFQLIPTASIHGNPHKSRGGHIDRIDIARPAEHGGGVSSIYIDTIESYKHAKMSAESSDWDVIHLDEPCPESMFQAHARGLVDRQGKFWINCTPLTEMWINDMFTPKNKRLVDMAPDGREFVVGKNNNVSRFIITWSIYDNPHNSQQSIDEFEELFKRDPVNLECRINGLPSHMSGLVYPEFVWDMHVLCDVPKGWKDFNDPPKNYTIRVWWDVHISKHQALLFFATAPDGTVYIYDEMFYTKYIAQNAELLKEKIAGRNCISLEIDPNAVIEDPNSETSVIDTLASHDLFFMPATKDRTQGTLKVGEKLRERGHHDLPTIYFSPNLTQTLFEMTHYVKDPETGKPVDKDDHMMENLYRAVLSGLDYVTPSDEDKLPVRPEYSRHNAIHLSRHTYA
jgi:hypothetical protein